MELKASCRVNKLSLQGLGWGGEEVMESEIKGIVGERSSLRKGHCRFRLQIALRQSRQDKEWLPRSWLSYPDLGAELQEWDLATGEGALNF